jgi:hypothetical protein
MSHRKNEFSFGVKCLTVALFVIVLSNNLVIGQPPEFKRIFKGELNEYQSALWFPNSTSFSVQALENTQQQQDKLTNLYVYSISPDDGMEEIKVFDFKTKKKRGPVKNSAYLGKYEERVAGSLLWKNGGVDFFCYRANWDQTNRLEERFYTFNISETGSIKIPRPLGIGENYQQYSGLAQVYSPPNAQFVFLTFRNKPGRNVLVKGTSEYYLDLSVIHQFDLPIQTISVSNDNSQSIIITGKETEYQFWESDDNLKFNQLDIPSDEFTIYSEAQICPSNNSIFSYLASNYDLRIQHRGVLCVFNLNTKNYLKKLDVFRHVQIDRLEQSYHQWDPHSNVLYYLARDKDEKIELWYWNMDTNISKRTSLNEYNIQGFSISPDGKYILITTNDHSRNLRVFTIN